MKRLLESTILTELAEQAAAGQLPPRPDSRGGGYQRQKRLNEWEIEELVKAYQAGGTVYELGERFAVDRRTVSIILERQGVARRYRALHQEQVARAAELYRAGMSLARVGQEVGVTAGTIARALAGAGVATRPGRGGPKRRQ